MSTPVSRMAVSYLLCSDSSDYFSLSLEPQGSEVPEEPDSVQESEYREDEEEVSAPKAVALIRHHEAKKFYYAIGKAFEANPQLSQAALQQQVEGLSSRSRCYEIVADMAASGFLLSNGKRSGYTPTKKFLEMESELQKWSQLELNESRATLSLLNHQEQQRYKKSILDLFKQKQTSLDLAEVSREIEGINRDQVLYLLQKLTRQEERLSENMVGSRRVWSFDCDHTESEEREIPAVAVPSLAKPLEPFTELALATIYQHPGLPMNNLKGLDGFKPSKLAHALRKLKSMQLIKSMRNGRKVSWYPFETTIPDGTAARKSQPRRRDESELASAEFQDKVIDTVRKRPFITTTKLYGAVSCRATFTQFEESLKKLATLTGHQLQSKYFWCITGEKYADVTKLDIPTNYRAILHHVKYEPGIMRGSLKSRTKLSEGTFSRAVKALSACQLLRREDRDFTVHYYLDENRLAET